MIRERKLQSEGCALCEVATGQPCKSILTGEALSWCHAQPVERITLCDGCTPLGNLEQITIGVLVGKCELCGAKCPPVDLKTYRRREVDIAYEVERRMMPGPARLG